MRVLVTGATGLVGKAICQRLAADDHRIVVLSRQPGTARVVPQSIAYHWEPVQAPPVSKVWEGVDAVIHLAGEPVVGFRWTEERKRRIRDSRVRGTRHLVASLKTALHRPKVIVSASAIGYYGNRGDERLDENSAPGQGFLSDLCQEWEHEALKARELGVRVVLVRVGLVLSLAGGVMEKMLLPFSWGLGGRLGGGRQWFPWIHIDDIVGIFKHAMLSSKLEGPLNGTAPGIVSNAEFTREFAAQLRRPAFLPVPELALRMVAGEMAEAMLSSQRVHPKNTLRSGYRFNYRELKPALQNLLLPRNTPQMHDR